MIYLPIMQASDYLRVEHGRAPRHRRAVQGPGRSQPAQAPGPAACARRPHTQRAVRAPGHDAAGRDAAPGRAGGGEPGGHRVARTREVALPQSGAAAGNLRALDSQVRKAAPEGARRPETTTGENPWLDRPLSTSAT